VHVPTLLIYGEQDIYRRPCGFEGLEEYVTNLIIKRLPDANHWITVEKPDLLNSFLHEFFSNVRSSTNSIGR